MEEKRCRPYFKVKVKIITHYWKRKNWRTLNLVRKAHVTWALGSTLEDFLFWSLNLRAHACRSLVLIQSSPITLLLFYQITNRLIFVFSLSSHCFPFWSFALFLRFPCNVPFTRSFLFVSFLFFHFPFCFVSFLFSLSPTFSLLSFLFPCPLLSFPLFCLCLFLFIFSRFVL